MRDTENYFMRLWALWKKLLINTKQVNIYKECGLKYNKNVLKIKYILMYLVIVKYKNN